MSEPPLHSSVVDLYCLFPYTHGIIGDPDYQIIPNSSWLGSSFPLPKRLLPPFPTPDVGWNEFREWPREEYIDRRFYNSCPLLPPHWFKLTEWYYGDQGVYSVVDVETGIAFEVEEGDGVRCNIDVEGHTGVAFQAKEGNVDAEWEVVSPAPTLKSWKVRSDSEKPVELLLKEWIAKFLRKEWIAVPFQSMISANESGTRGLEMKRLLLEFGWPGTFPLEIDQYREFLARVRQIQKEDWAAVLNVTSAWAQFGGLRKKWYEQNLVVTGAGFGHLKSDLRDQRVEAIDDEIWRIVTYERQAEHATHYAQMTGEDIDECFREEGEMEENLMDGFVFGPDEVMTRWANLRALATELELREMDMLHELLQKAYKRRPA